MFGMLRRKQKTRHEIPKQRKTLLIQLFGVYNTIAENFFL